jgi:phosphatidylserine/phosphatidylglycerophosphate/cardiolipin synthase-like enzyme
MGHWKLRTLLLGIIIACSLGSVRAADPQIYFSRSDPVARILTGEIDTAQKSIHLLIYSLTDDDVARALIRAAQRGVDVRIVMDRSQSAEKHSLNDLLTEKLGPSRVVERTGKGRGIMHEKMAIYDGVTVTLGSYNWTDGARDYNWENLIVLRDAQLAAKCESEFRRVWSSPAPKIPAKKKAP